MNARDMTAALLTLSLVAACGGDGKKPSTKKASKAHAPDPEEYEEPESEPPPKAKRKPKQVYAKAALTPVKGSKLRPALVSFSQRKGDDTNIESDSLRGAKPGTYWLVLHDGDSCGQNATKAGPPWSGAADTKLRIVIGKDRTGGLEATEAAFALTGDAGAVGHTLVLHEDKKGKAGKALACGVIEEVDEP